MRSIVAVILIASISSGCTQKLAERLVRAPNLDWPREYRDDATPQRLEQLQVSQQFRVDVNSPPASIDVFVIEPTNQPQSITLERVGWRLEARIHPDPTRRPTTLPAHPRATLFMLHGIAEDMELGPYVIYRELLTHAGFRVIQVDFRGHGRSTGQYIGYGAFESHDMVQVLDELERRNLVIGDVGVLGVSYGGAVAIQWAAIDPRVKAIVALEPYCNLRDAAHDAAPFVLRDTPISFDDEQIDKAIDLAGRIAGFDPDSVDAISAIRQTKAPVLLIHSLADELVPYHHSVRLHQAAPDHSKLILVEGQSHFNMWLWSMTLIRAQTLAWFGKYLHVPGNDVHKSATAPAVAAHD